MLHLRNLRDRPPLLYYWRNKRNILLPHPNSRLVFSLLTAILITIAYACPAFAQSLLRDTEIEETLSEYTDPILRAAGLTPSNVDLYLVNDPSLNAFVTRGQNIFLHSGIILESDTPNQLKGVIAHEAGHIAGGHIVRSDYGNRSAYGAILIAAGIGLAAILAGEAEAGSLILGGSQQFGVIESLAYSRVNESAADQYAAQYMERTGQSTQGLIDFFDKFRAQEVLSQARRYPYFRGHPLSADRIDALREKVEESEYTVQRDSYDHQHRLDMAKAKLRGFLEGPQLVFSRYPPQDTSKPARYARAVAHFKAADLRNAIREIDSLIEEEPENAYFYELKAQILYESGQGDKSIAPAKRALELKPDSPLLKLALAQALLETSDGASVQQSVDLLKSGLVSEPQNGFMWYTLSRAYGELNQEALARYATAEQAYVIGDVQRARSFAQRAQEDLPRNGPQWRRASDIIVISDSELAKKRSKRTRRKPLTFQTDRR